MHDCVGVIIGGVQHTDGPLQVKYWGGSWPLWPLRRWRLWVHVIYVSFLMAFSFRKILTYLPLLTVTYFYTNKQTGRWRLRLMPKSWNELLRHWRSG